MSSPVNQQVTIKAKREGTQEMRRFTLRKDGLTFATLQTKLSTYFGYSRVNAVTIKYIDTDGDKITVGSDEELREAVTMVDTSGILRVSISNATSGRCASSAVAPIAINVCRTPRLPVFLEKVTQNLIKKVNDDKLTKDISTLVFVIAKNLPSFYRTSPKSLSQVQTMIENQLVKILHSASLQLLDTNKSGAIEKSKAYLKAILKLDPKDNIAWYNSACAEALLGHTENAVVMLSQSVYCGFKNVRHLKTDKDLDSIRSHKTYKNIVAKLEELQRRLSSVNASILKNKHRSYGCAKRRVSARKVNSRQLFLAQLQSAAKKRAAKPIVEPKRRVVLVPRVTTSQIKKANDLIESLKLLETMGFSNKKTSLQALIRSKGNIQRAVNILLA